jgi:glycosyltransferase involved in cell wall biosynthesis
VGIEGWIVAKLLAVEPFVPRAWRASVRRLVLCALGWLTLPPEFVRYCYSQLWGMLHSTPPSERLSVAIVEPHLGSRSAIGHELLFSLTLATRLREQGVSVHVLGHRRLDPAMCAVFEQRGIPCRRIFRQSDLGTIPVHDADGRLGALGRFLAHACTYAADLTWGLARGGIHAPRVLFFPTSGLSCMFGSALLRSFGAAGARRESQIHVLHRPPQLGDGGSYLSYVRRRLRRSRRIGVHIGTVNPLVNTRLRALGESEAIEIPIPRPTDLQHRAASESAPRRVGFMGAAAVDKGFTRLPTLLPRLLESHQSLRIVVQVNASTAGSALSHATEHLRDLARRSGRIELVEESLAMDRYYELLNSIDVVVLPYDAERYALSISSVGIEAMALGKVVVGPDVGWFAQQPDAYGGYLATDTGDLEQLASRILEAVGDFDTLARRAERDVPRLAWHNVQSLVRVLRDVAEQDGIGAGMLPQCL